MESGSAAVEKFDSHHLRDFLRIKEEDHHSRINQRIAANGGVVGRGSVSGVTLGAVLSDRNIPVRPADGPQPRVLPNRTLLDVIRDDRNTQRRDRMSWLQLREKLRLRRGAGSSSWASTFPVPTSAMSINTSSNSNSSNPAILRRNPTVFPNTAESSNQAIVSSTSSSETSSVNRTADRTNGRFEPILSRPTRISERESNGNAAEEVEEDGDQYEQQPARMSLMALLEETDRQLGYDAPSYTAEHEEEVVATATATATPADMDGGMINTCCVCMVRQKGAAFIPCGHTFCRVCCRELLSQRGNCPLCNNHIFEILDIF